MFNNSGDFGKPPSLGEAGSHLKGLHFGRQAFRIKKMVNAEWIISKKLNIPIWYRNPYPGTRPYGYGVFSTFLVLKSINKALPQSCLQIGNQILYAFYADAQADKRICQPDLHAFFLWDGGVGHGSGMPDEGLHSS